MDTERSVSSRFRAFGVQPLGCVDGIRSFQRNRHQRERIGCDQQRLHENECAGGTAFPCRASVALGRELGVRFLRNGRGTGGWDLGGSLAGLSVGVPLDENQGDA